MKAGRKPLKEAEKKKNISITMSKNAVEKLTSISEKNNTTRGQEVEKLLSDINV